MKRRDFLKSSALAAAGCFDGVALARRRAHPVMTVLGPVPAASLGRTLMHEHVLVDFVGANRIAPGRYDSAEVFRTALPHLQKLKSAGCGTLVECTPAYLGRDPELLRRLSRASGLHIVTNTGFYGAADDKYIPSFARSERAEELAARWQQEYREGIPPSGIRPGLIKTGVDAGPLSEVDAKLVAAAALTHRHTGLAIASHTPDGIAALAQLSLLNDWGVQPSAFIWVHAQSEPNQNLHRQAAALSAWVEFDGINPDTSAQHVELLAAMKSSGYLHRTLMSQDAGWYHVGEPSGGNYHGYDYLFLGFIPQLRKAGFTESDIETLLIVNPQKALALRA